MNEQPASENPSDLHRRIHDLESENIRLKEELAKSIEAKENLKAAYLSLEDENITEEEFVETMKNGFNYEDLMTELRAMEKTINASSWATSLQSPI